MHSFSGDFKHMFLCFLFMYFSVFLAKNDGIPKTC